MRRSWVVVAVAALGCGSSDQISDANPGDGAPPDVFDPNSGPRSGTRIKVISYAYEGGAKSYGYGGRGPLFDDQLATDCTVRPWTNSMSYCTPVGKEISGFGYSDPQCTLLQASDDRMLANPYIVLLEPDPSDLCSFGPVSRVYKVALAPPGTMSYQLATDGTCIQAGSSAFVYNVVSEITPNQLVSVTSILAGTGRFQARYAIGADGFQFPVAIHDSVNDFDCEPEREQILGSNASQLSDEPTSDGVCIPACPTMRVSSTGFKDAQCTQAVISAMPDPQFRGPPKFVAEMPQGACTTGVKTLYRVAETATTSAVYFRNPSTSECTPSPGPSQQIYELAPLDIGAVALHPSDSSSQITSLVNSLPGLDYTDQLLLVDTTLMSLCRTTDLTPDGTLRCFPGLKMGFLSSFFSDSTCQTAMALTAMTVPVGCPSPVPIFARNSTEIRRVSDETTAPIFRLVGGNCIQVDPVSSGSQTHFFTVGESVPISTFALATLQRDP